MQAESQRTTVRVTGLQGCTVDQVERVVRGALRGANVDVMIQDDATLVRVPGLEARNTPWP